MSGGKRIDDHRFFAGGPSKESPMPMESKMKQERSAEGAGHEVDYQDTTEAIKRVQEEGDRKAKARPLKSGYRY